MTMTNSGDSLNSYFENSVVTLQNWDGRYPSNPAVVAAAGLPVCGDQTKKFDGASGHFARAATGVEKTAPTPQMAATPAQKFVPPTPLLIPDMPSVPKEYS